MKKIALVLAGLTLALGAAACSQQDSQSAPESKPAEMPNSSISDTPAQSAMTTSPVQGVGVVTDVDATAGTVTLDHQAINAIPWPAMTMRFEADDPSILKGVTTGDHVTFAEKRKGLWNRHDDPEAIDTMFPASAWLQ